MSRRLYGTTFVGRTADVDALRRGVASDALVTVVGAGGCGKSRLVAETFADAVFADLATVERGAALVLLRALEREPGPGERLVDACRRHLAGSDRIVVLDGCEHLLDEAAELAVSLMAGGPGVRVVATSREPLRWPQERLMRLEPLSPAEAVALFDDRAQRVTAPGAADDDVLELVDRLDRLPLAIEIAAARSAAVPVAELLRLRSAWPTVLSGRRSVDTRHLSVVACIEWSTGLLVAHEREVLRRLTVFRAPFTIEAANAVAGEAASTAIPELVEKSLVRLVSETAGGARYALFELVRDVAARHLAVHVDEDVATRRAHLARLLTTALEYEAHFDGPHVIEAISALRAELPDIRAAIEWATTVGLADDAQELVGALWRFWWAGARGEGYDAVRTALTAIGASPAARCRALIAGVLAASTRFEFSVAIAFGEEAIALAEIDGDPRLIARARCWHGWMLAMLQSPDASAHLRRAEELARSSGDSISLADSLNALATIAVTRGDPLAAIRLAGEVLTITAATGNMITQCHASATAATASLMLGELDDAQRIASGALTDAAALTDDVYVVLLSIVLCWAAALRKSTATADDHADRAVRTAHHSGNPLLGAVAGVAVGLAAWAAGDAAGCASALEGSTGAYAAINPAAATELAVLRADALAVLGRRDTISADVDGPGPWSQMRKRLARARWTSDVEAAHEVLTAAVETRDVNAQVDALDVLAAAHLREGTHERAVELAVAAESQRARVGYHARPFGASTTDELLLVATAAIGASSVAQASARSARLGLADAVARAQGNRGRRRRPVSGVGSLTPAERRVAQLVAGGLTNGEIASQLCVSPQTVKGHVAAALRKLQVPNRTALVGALARQIDP